MQLPLLNFAAIVGNAASAVQGSARQLLDVSVGSTMRAVLEANASLALWLQWLIVQVLQMTRAATSIGSDLDTWVGDFSLTRLPATPAAGQVTISRFTATSATTLPAGTLVRTADGTQTFQVVADITNAAWQPVVGAYALLAGVTSVTVPVLATTLGSGGNVQPAAVSLLATAVPGIDLVQNVLPFAGGVDAETDGALRSRFQLFLQTLSRATPLSVGAAVLSTRQGLSYAITENATPDGNQRYGSFVVTVDDGTGSPSAATLAAAAAAIEATRPIGTTFAVLPPSVLGVTVELTVAVVPGASHGVVAANVAAAVTAFVDALGIGASLSATRLVQVAFNADLAVSNVANVTVNGATSDVSPGPRGVVKLTALQVS